jgi:hypothetical protein
VKGGTIGKSNQSTFGCCFGSLQLRLLVLTPNKKGTKVFQDDKKTPQFKTVIVQSQAKSFYCYLYEKLPWEWKTFLMAGYLVAMQILMVFVKLDFM